MQSIESGLYLSDFFNCPAFYHYPHLCEQEYSYKNKQNLCLWWQTFLQEFHVTHLHGIPIKAH